MHIPTQNTTQHTNIPIKNTLNKPSRCVHNNLLMLPEYNYVHNIRNEKKQLLNKNDS